MTLGALMAVVAGRVLVRDGKLTLGGIEGKLREHAAAAARIQGV